MHDSQCKLLHHCAEFIELDLSVPVHVNLLYYVHNRGRVLCTVKTQDFLDLVRSDCSAPVLTHQLYHKYNLTLSNILKAYSSLSLLTMLYVFIVAMTNSVQSMVPLPSMSISLNILSTSSSLMGTPKCSSQPSRISYLLRLPSPSLSMAWKIFSRCSVSSLLTSWLAMKARAACFNFISPRKFLRLDKVFVATCLSIFSAYAICLIHLCWIASPAVMRLSGSRVSNRLTRSLASSLTSSHSGSSRVNLPFNTASMIYLSFAPLNGGQPQRRMYRITPQLHKSHFSLQLFFSTSGAIQ